MTAPCVKTNGPPNSGNVVSTSCWLCGHPIEDPPQIIGTWCATNPRVAHRRCLRVLGELELDLPAESAGPTSSHEGAGPAA